MSQHADEETNLIRETYEAALQEIRPDLSPELINTLSEMVTKKARYGINYEEEMEELLREVNADLLYAYSQAE